MARAISTNNVVNKKSFSLADYKKKNNVDNTAFKPNRYLELGEAFKEATSLPGLLIGGVNMIMGHSDSGKTTAMVKGAISSQKLGRLPIFIITEMKWSWQHAKIMGLEFEEVLDEETGEINNEGNFIYIDKLQLKSIEDVAQFINKTLDDQDKGLLPYDIDFFWDSVGSVPSQMSIDKGKNNNEWAAGAMSVQFGSSINQRITASRRSGSKYTNTLVVVNKVWVEKPSNPMGQPKIKPKGGTTMYFDAILVIRFGNISSSGTNKIKAVKNKKTMSFASRTAVTIQKNHITGVETEGKIIITPQGYIHDTKKDIELYKKENMDYLVDVLGSSFSDGDFDIEIDESEEVMSLDDVTEMMEDLDQ